MSDPTSPPTNTADPADPADGSDAAGRHEGPIRIDPALNVGAPAAIGLVSARFVRYPGCQQLVLWLPQSGLHGYRELCVIGPDGAERERTSLRSRLNGSVQILFDTLAWPPGPYRIEVDHDDGWRHELTLLKREPGVEEPEPPAPAAPAAPAGASAEAPGAAAERPPIVYRDGFGRIVPDVDLQLRQAVFARMARQFSRHLEYDGNYRAGTITYVDGPVRIAFPHEMGGGGCKFVIDLPSAAAWEAATGTALSERDQIVRFVADRVQRDQASRWRYEIDERTIAFY
jgi:hypothetical protein